VERSDKALTPYGGLVAFATFLKATGIIEKLVDSCPVQRSSPNATPVRDIVVGFILTCVVEGKRFKHIRYIQNDEVIGKLFGVERRIPGDDAVRRFFEELEGEAGRRWLHQAYTLIYHILPERYVLDWDSTVTTRYGAQEGVAVGYNPHKPGRGSHHPLVCSVSGLRVCLDLDFRSGDSSSGDGWIEAMEQVLQDVPRGRWPYLNRGDISFGHEDFLAWHEAAEERPYYLFKLRKTARVREALRGIREEDWQGGTGFGALQVAEARLCLMGWSRERRIVLGRRLLVQESPAESGTLFGTCQYEYSAWVTDLPAEEYTAFQVAELYQQRADSENVFDELKNQWGLAGFCSQHAHVTELAARLTLLSYNLWSIFVRFFSGSRHQEAQTSRRDYLFLASQLVESGRERTIHMSVSQALWERLQQGYDRLMTCLRQTAPQLKLESWFSGWGQAMANALGPPGPKLLTANCGF
jgi:hypothetical protein